MMKRITYMVETRTFTAFLIVLAIGTVTFYLKGDSPGFGAFLTFLGGCLGGVAARSAVQDFSGPKNPADPNAGSELTQP